MDHVALLGSTSLGVCGATGLRGASLHLLVVVGLDVGAELVEVQVPVRVILALLELRAVLQVLLGRRQPADDRRNGGQLGGRQVHVGALAQPVREVARGRGHDRGAGGHTGLVAHAQRAARHLQTSTARAVDVVVALVVQLLGVHLRGRRDPQARVQLALVVVQKLAGGTEVADVRHARADEDLVDLRARAVAEGDSVVRVVRGAQDGLLDVVHVDLDDVLVLGVLVRLHELRVLDPRLHLLGTAQQRAHVAVALRDHPPEHHDVALQVLNDRLLVQLDRATGGAALRARVGQLEGLLNLQVLETLDLQHLAAEGVDLVLLRHRQEAQLNRLQGDGVHQVTERDARLHLAREANQDRLRHVQGDHTRGGTEGHQARASREGDTDREPGVRVSTRSDRVRQKHPVQPRVDDTVGRAQGHTAPGLDEVRQSVVHLHVDRLRVRGRVAERLHHKVGGEAEAGQVLQLVTGHGTRGVLRSHRRHLRLAVHARADTGKAAGLADHLLGKRVALVARGRLLRLVEDRVVTRLAERGTGLVRQATADDERDTAAGAHLVEEHVGLEGELREHLGRAVLVDLAVLDVDRDGVAHVQVVHRALDRQSAGVLHGVEEDGGDLRAQDHAAGLLVGHGVDLLADVPQHAVRRRLPGRAGSDNVANVHERQAVLGLQLLDLLQGADLALGLRGDAVTADLQHGLRVERDVRARPRIRGGGQVVGVGLARHLQHRVRRSLGHLRALREPLGVGPRVEHLGGLGHARLVLLDDVVERVEDERRVLHRRRGRLGHRGVLRGKELHERGHVEPAVHLAENLDSLHLGELVRLLRALRNLREERRLDVGSVVDARRHALRQKLLQQLDLRGVGRGLQGRDSLGHLLGVQRLRRQTLRGALSDVLVVGLHEGRGVAALHGAHGDAPEGRLHFVVGF
eukprot:Rhum_TRINITY_DN14425_c20_g1::Rhum_TRINITY_DN14425_c20_g1_i1::g.90169::m.90169